MQYAKRILGYESLLGLVRLFTLNQEANLPTWFSALLLLSAALLLLVVAVLKHDRGRRSNGPPALGKIFAQVANSLSDGLPSARSASSSVFLVELSPQT